MGTFEDLRRRVTVQAARAGYELKRNNRPPYGWSLISAGSHEPVKSGSLDHLENWLAEQWATACSDSGSDRRNG
ncbi:hypothetical protein NONI108955_08780 [Nocardia ninae]|uniref:hypothetical protein n=1 Tax=Nocardia ninae TaxID=356145 RepID=UPI0031DB7A86